MPALVRAVIDHLDGTSEASEWHVEGSAEADEAISALIRNQTKEGFAVRLEKAQIRNPA